MDRIKLFECIFDNALEIYITHDKQCKVVYANKNAETELGYDNRLNGVDIFTIFPFNGSITESG